MNTGQTLMSVGAMILLGYTVLTTNRTNLTHGVILRQTEIGVYMISLAISRIEEASGKAFDAATAGDIITSTGPLTASDSFGPMTGEVYPHFNDFDDYHDFADTTYVAGVDNLVVYSEVRYVTMANPDVTAGTKTFHKRMDVKVYSLSQLDTLYTTQRDTLKMSYIFSYWSFR